MHNDNLAFSEKIAAWQRDPANKEHSVRGDDRSPPWIWIGYTYHDGKHISVPADNIMTLIRDAAKKVSTGKGSETYAKRSQSGLLVDGVGFDLLVGEDQVPIDLLNPLIGNLDFSNHIEAAEAMGFELLVKRAKVGQAKHVRVRPMFRNWTAIGSITVFDEQVSGLTQPILDTVFRQAGSLIGIGDWRPSSPKSSGTFGRFEAAVEAV